MSKKRKKPAPLMFDEADVENIIDETTIVTIMAVLEALVKAYGPDRIQSCLDAVAQ